jgi:hypothetical protein
MLADANLEVVELAFRTSRSAFGSPPFGGDDRGDGHGVKLVGELA